MRPYYAHILLVIRQQQLCHLDIVPIVGPLSPFDLLARKKHNVPLLGCHVHQLFDLIPQHFWVVVLCFVEIFSTLNTV